MMRNPITILLKPLTLRIERKQLGGVVVGVGVAPGSILINTKFVTERLVALKQALARRGAIVHDLTGVQSLWISRPLDKRGAYRSEGIQDFPDAKYYVVLSLSDMGAMHFGVYGAAFDPFITASGHIDLVMAVIFKGLDHYFEDSLCGHIALLMAHYPEAFSGQLWYPPESARAEIKRVFTLPPDFK
jgi:hypothetical protein